MGTRSLRFALNFADTNHPHAYGDKIPVLVTVAFSLGSSPRVWGQVSDTLTVTGAARIIPTRMGTSKRICTLTVGFWDHPHAYGDKTNKYYTNPFAVGSSPRVWGQDCEYIRTESGERIIPTRMGTSSSDKQNSRSKRDHPHAYGDKIASTISSMFALGSSPRVWGQAYTPTCVYGG